ncbi:unnamed protein product [Meloidogyne enterolobii]|uniref:Uncharacterized protein n=1 Tax=Meloidogyne enterolobii TaxID=390850 RepID=A0ACB1B3Z2_MELEN
MFPKSIVEMKFARYLLQLFFNCAFEYYLIDYTINPQMIKLLFDEDTTTIKPLQIHSQLGEVFLRADHELNFAVNHLICNQFRVRVYDSDVEPDLIDLQCFVDVENCIDILIEILKNEGNKFFEITYDTLDSRIYNSIIKHIETSQDLSKMAKYIEFDVMYGSLISSKNATNIKTKLKEDIKTTKFLLSNDHNPKIKFSVCIEDKYKRIDVSSYEEDIEYYIPGVRVVIKRIK